MLTPRVVCASGMWGMPQLCIGPSSAALNRRRKKNQNPSPNVFFFPEPRVQSIRPSRAAVFRNAVAFWGQTSCNLTGLSPKRECGSQRVNPFRTPVPFWGQGTQTPSNLSQIAPKTGLRFQKARGVKRIIWGGVRRAAAHRSRESPMPQGPAIFPRL